MAAEEEAGAVTLSDYLGVLKRRKWVFLAVLSIVPVVAVALSVSRGATYASSAQVLLDVPNPTEPVGQTYSDPGRAAQTQADLARVGEVTRLVEESGRFPGLTSSELLKASTVVASPDSDFLTFTVTDADPEVADQLATAYADAYVEYRRRLDLEQVTGARAAAERKRRELEAAGLAGTVSYKDLVETIATLDTYQPQKLVVLDTADAAEQVGPHLKRNAGIALALGLVLAATAAFLWDMFDTRVRSLGAVRRSLEGMRLLGGLPAPSRRVRKSEQLVMLTAPASEDAEPYRVLRANFDFAASEVGARIIMVTSGVGGEGKTTTAANLAVALARAGRRVVLIDFDLRNPHLHQLFRVDQHPGLIDVALLDARVEDVLVEVPVTERNLREGNGRHGASDAGRLDVLPAGATLDDPDEIRADRVIPPIVEALLADYVLIDAGPLLPSGDAIALSAYVDAILLIVRLNVLPTSALDELRRVVASSPAAKLGFVLTDARPTAHRQSQHSGSMRRHSDLDTSPAGPVDAAAGDGAGTIASGTLSENGGHGGELRRPV